MNEFDVLIFLGTIVKSFEEPNQHFYISWKGP